jgi:protein gp37
MNRTKIEWCDYVINPVKGLCPMACSYCYARRLYKRFKWNPEIRLDRMAVAGIESMKPGSKVFWGSTIELFHDSIPWEYLQFIFGIVNCYPKLNHIFLTKQPQNLIKWSPFPENCWVGVTATNKAMAEKALHYLFDIKANVKYISFEPLLESIAETKYWLVGLPCEWERINWLIIGQQTPISAKTQPKKIWIDEIISASQKAGIPYFLKDNLRSIMGDNLVQDFPKGVDFDH